MKLVEIEWIDSAGLTSTWEYKEELEPLDPIYCRTVGFLLHDGDAYKTLVMSTSETQVLGRVTIPIQSIVRISTLSIKDEETDTEWLKK